MSASLPDRSRKTPVWRRRRLVWALAPLLAFIAFEAGIRAIPPDTVQVTTTPHGVSYGASGYGPTTTQTITNPGAVAALRGAVTARMTSYPAWFPFTFVPTCSGGFGESVTYRFTWHGIPVEVASGDSGNCGDLVLLAVSSGGLTAPFLYYGS